VATLIRLLELQAALDAYQRHIEVLDFPDKAALHYAQIRAALKVYGSMTKILTVLTLRTMRFSWRRRLVLVDTIRCQGKFFEWGALRHRYSILGP
jgi:hypothetical protein